jgi:hypothetical protein
MRVFPSAESLFETGNRQFRVILLRSTELTMITGVHVLMYAKSAAATRRFFKDTLSWPHVDAGHGWLIFATPPAEIAAHPAGKEAERNELYFMCDNLDKTMADLKEKGIEFVGKVSNQAWGKLATFKLPGAGQMGLYEPRHPIAAGKKIKKQPRKS